MQVPRGARAQIGRDEGGTRAGRRRASAAASSAAGAAHAHGGRCGARAGRIRRGKGVGRIGGRANRLGRGAGDGSNPVVEVSEVEPETDQESAEDWPKVMLDGVAMKELMIGSAY